MTTNKAQTDFLSVALTPSSVVTGTEQVFARQNVRSTLRKKLRSVGHPLQRLVRLAADSNRFEPEPQQPTELTDTKHKRLGAEPTCGVTNAHHKKLPETIANQITDCQHGQRAICQRSGIYFALPCTGPSYWKRTQRQTTKMQPNAKLSGDRNVAGFCATKCAKHIAQKTAECRASA